MDASILRLGFACYWRVPASATWSGTPWVLRSALSERIRLIDLGVRLPSTVETLLKLGHVRLTSFGLSSVWEDSAVTDRILGRQLRFAARETRPDAVLQIQDLAVFGEPYFTYQDLSYSALIHLHDQGFELEQFPGLSLRRLRAREERQREVYERATGVLVFSDWLKELLVRQGLDHRKAHRIHPGANVDRFAGVDDPRVSQSGGEQSALSDRSHPPRLLFVGRDFHRKGGDLVVEAFIRLKREFADSASLVVAGPRRWPMKRPPPQGVRFLGDQSPAAVHGLMRSADLFVMPSRFEAFGIVFAEALSAGVPCVARRSFAMPEIVRDGVNGALVETSSVTELVSAMVRVLEDEALRNRVWEDRPLQRRYWSWDRAADEMVGLMYGESN